MNHVAKEVRCLRCGGLSTCLVLGDGVVVVLSHGSGWLRRQCPTSGQMTVAWQTPDQALDLKFRFVNGASWVAVAGPNDASEQPAAQPPSSAIPDKEKGP